jgi:hypothetical protein
MQNRRHIFLAIALLIFLAVLGAIMSRQIPSRIDLPFELSSTSMAAEFAATPMEVNEVISADRAYVQPLKQQQYLDFISIPAYVALLVILGLALRTYEIPGARWLAWIAVVCAILAGLCDIAENVTILKVISLPTPLSSKVRWFSLPKWTLVFLVMTIESLLFFFWPALKLWWRIAAVIVGALFLFVGSSGLLFSLLVSITDIAWSASWMVWAFSALLLFLIALVIRRTPLRY